MTEDLGLEIRKQVARYLAAETDLSAFHSAIAPLVWNIEQRTDPASADLGREVALLLAEAANGDWNEVDLRAQLSPMVTNYVALVGNEAPVFGSMSAVIVSQIILADPEPVQGRQLPFDRSRAGAF